MTNLNRILNYIFKYVFQSYKIYFIIVLTSVSNDLKIIIIGLNGMFHGKVTSQCVTPTRWNVF